MDEIQEIYYFFVFVLIGVFEKQRKLPGGVGFARVDCLFAEIHIDAREAVIVCVHNIAPYLARIVVVFYPDGE